MYWSKYRGGIFKAEMDSSDSAQIVAGLQGPVGIAIDFDSHRIFWMEYEAHRVLSSNLNGTDMHLVADLDDRTHPWGIAVEGGRLYWGAWDVESLQTSDKTGKDMRTLYSGHGVLSLAVAHADPLHTRSNHCQGRVCSIGICVLTRNSFRCIP